MSTRAIFDAGAILACSLMGVLVSIDRHRRFGAAMAVGVVASIAGGSVRDLFLGTTPVFWIRQPWQIYLAFASTAALFLTLRNIRVRESMLLLPDAFSVAIPAAIGAKAALMAGSGGGIAAVTGLIAGMIGGILRDLLCEREPAVLKRELYGAAALVGGAAVALLSKAGRGELVQLAGGTAVGAAVRIIAVHKHISFGKLVLKEDLRRPRG